MKLPKDATHTPTVTSGFLSSLFIHYATLLLCKEFFHVVGGRLRVSWVQTTLKAVVSILAPEREI